MLHAPAELAGRLLELKQSVECAVHNRRKCKNLLQAAGLLVRSLEIAQVCAASHSKSLEIVRRWIANINLVGRM
jgi:hypothetical protein